MSTRTTVELDRKRIAELTERERRASNERTRRLRAVLTSARAPRSAAASPPPTRRATPGRSTCRRARRPSSGTSTATRCWDFHNGFGSMVQGHAQPGDRPRDPRARRARHALRRPTEDGDRRRRGARSARFGLRAGALSTRAPRRRWTRSGSRAGYRTRDDRQDLRLLPRPPRRRDGLDRRPYDKIGDRENYASLPYGAGIPRASPTSRSRCRSTTPRRWSGASSGSRRRAQAGLRDHGGGDDEPRGGAARARLPPGGTRADRRHGILLIFDEVKTGLAIAAGGATERFGVTADMVTLAKTLGGGLPAARSAAPRR